MLVGAHITLAAQPKMPHVLAVMPANSFASLQRDTPATWRLERAGLDELLRRAESVVGCVIVADLVALNDDAYRRVVAVASRAGATIVWYADALRPRAVHRLAESARILPSQVFLHGAENPAGIVRWIVGQTDGASLPSLLLQSLIARFDALPNGLGTRLAEAYAWGQIPRTPEALYHGLGVGAHTARGWIRHAGLQRASRLLAGARVARAHEYGKMTPRDTLDSIAFRSGFSGLDGLDAACRLVSGVGPRWVCRGRPAADVAVVMTERLIR